MSRGGAAQAVHDGHAEAGFRHGFGHDGIDAGLIEFPHDEKQADRRFGKLAAAGAQRLDDLPLVRTHEGSVRLAGVAEQGVALAGFGLEILRPLQ